jgi:hypothetical protein
MRIAGVFGKMIGYWGKRIKRAAINLDNYGSFGTKAARIGFLIVWKSISQILTVAQPGI